MLNAQQPAPGLALEVFDAIGRKAWGELAQLAAADIQVEVHGAPGISTSRNAHVWRAVSLVGRDALQEYLVQLHAAAPGLAVQARSAAHVAGHDVVRADCAGVDSAGSAFAAEADFAIWVENGSLVRLEASINGLDIGAEVIRHGEGDPRKYFSSFLDQ